MFLKQIQTYAVIHMQNQVLKKPVKLHSSQNVNISYISTSQDTFQILEGVFFCVFRYDNGYEFFKPAIHFIFFASANRCSNFS